MSRSLLLAVLLVGPVTSAPRPKDKAPPATYWPTKVGAVFEYGLESGGTMTREVTGVERAGDVITVTMSETGADGKVKPGNKVEVRPDGLFITEESGMPYDPPLCLFKASAKPGERWTTASRWGNRDLPEAVREVGESKVLQTPAGKIEAVPISVSTKFEKKPSVYWFAREYGIVQIDGYRTLTKYTPAK